MSLTLTVPGENDTFERELVTKGEHDAVLCEIHDDGLVDDIFNPGKRKHQLRATFQFDEEIEAGQFAGQPREIMCFLTASLHPKATLRKMLEGIRGKTLAPDEKIDILKLRGIPCRAYVTHYMGGKDGTTKKCKIADWSPAGPNKLEVRDYTPMSERGKGNDDTVSGAVDHEVAKAKADEAGQAEDFPF